MEKTYFISREDFITLKATWGATLSHSAVDMVFYNVLRSKPAVSGFVPKTKNVQSNDPWHAFNTAKSYAAFYINRTRVWNQVSRYWMDLSKEQRAEKFKAKWGIDLPEGLAEIIKESKHG